MNNKDKLLLVGKVVGVHGIHGEVKILPYGDCDKKPWKKLYLVKGENSLVCEMEVNRPHKDVILASLKGCDNRDKANDLVGYDVFVDEASLPLLPEGEYYHFQLQGMEVITDDGKKIGVITSIVATGSNDVYVVKGVSGEILIPATRDVILKVDVDARKIFIRLIQGLLPGENEGDT